MAKKHFTTFEEQIQILSDRGLLFHSKETAIQALKRYGYYNIINGYKDSYITIDDNGNERYKEGVSFEQIYSLYCMDRYVRNAILDSTLDVEDMLRNALAHTIAESFGEEESAYMNAENYHSGIKRKSRFKRDDILKKFQKILSDNDQEPIKYYRNNYGNVPPWIMLKGASFGNLVNFTKLQKGPQKNRVLSLLSGLPAETIGSIQEVKDLLMDTLFVCLDYRNTAAHGWRIYNYESSSTFRYSRILHSRLGISEADYRHGKGKTGITTLHSALSFLDNHSPAVSLQAGANVAIEEHCETYPEDLKCLQDYINFAVVDASM